MRDDGETRSVRMRRSVLFFLIYTCILMPFALAGLVWFGVHTWLAHKTLVAYHDAMQQEYLIAKATAARLADIERLLQRNDPAHNSQVLQNVRRADMQDMPQSPESDTANQSVLTSQPSSAMDQFDTADGPGHSEFPGVNTGKIQVENVVVRLMSGRNLRISLDLNNPDTANLVGGKIVCTLITASGQALPLRVFPQAADDFRISRFKRVVLTAPLPPNTSATDAQIVLEVKPEGGGPVLYRNIYAVAR